MRRSMTWLFGFAALVVFVAVPLGCEKREQVVVDGSSTVYPISREVSSRFQQQVEQNYFAPVSSHGTGGGFKKYVRGETDINDASRPIAPSEIKKAKKAGIGFIELPIAYDGLSVVVNKKNDWVDQLTMDELRRIWQPKQQAEENGEEVVKTWSDVRPSFPDKKIKLYGPDTESGTFDYFTKTVVGEEGASRKDYAPNSDDNVLVRGVAGNKHALGYFGYAYYAENKDRLNVVPIVRDGEPVEPNRDTIAAGSYPLARPLFIYVRPKSAKRKVVQKYVHFYLDTAPEAVKAAGYVPLPDELYKLVRKKFDQRVTGTMYGSDASENLSLKERLKASLSKKK